MYALIYGHLKEISFFIFLIIFLLYSLFDSVIFKSSSYNYGQKVIKKSILEKNIVASCDVKHFC